MMREKLAMREIDTRAKNAHTRIVSERLIQLEDCQLWTISQLDER